MKNQDLNINQEYKYGFTTDIESIRAPKGLNEESIKFISNIKKEPKWMLDWRLKAYSRLQSLKEPDWQNQNILKLIIKTYIIILHQKAHLKNLRV